MKAIILAAGRGSRMKHLTEEHPKCLIKLNGKPLIDWQIETIKSAGITEIAIVTGYKNNLLNNRGLVEFFNHRWETTNMVTSLICADSWLNNNDCIVSYSDIFYKKSAIKSLVDNKSNLAITFDPNWEELWSKRFGDPLLDAETFKLKNNKFLAEIGKPPNLLKEIEGQYMGLLKFTPKGWNIFKEAKVNFFSEKSDNVHMTSVLQAIIELNKENITAIPYNDVWGEFDSPEDLNHISI